jgi:glyceraldehyde 3-phosphate dehydrogenase
MERIKIGINGFGRIGRTLARVIQDHSHIELFAINDLVAPDNLAHLLKYDSIHGRFPKPISHDSTSIFIAGQAVAVSNVPNPAAIPWANWDVDFVIESTGRFKTTHEAKGHLIGGAKKVIISAPAQDLETKSIVMGVNDHLLTSEDIIVSNASCTTNSAAPLVKVLQSQWGIEKAYISTVHSYTSDQRLHDAPHSDWRRGRAAAESIVPTTTGAAKALTRIFPELDGHMGGAGIRVPVPNGSLTDLSCILHAEATIEEINSAFRSAAQGDLKGILEYTEEPIVSRDIIGNPHSSVFDAQLTSALGRMIKVVGWYDNEWGYSNRLVDLMLKMHQLSAT